MEVVSGHQLLSHLQCGQLIDKNNQENCLLLGYCGFDGFFRLIDLLNVNNVMTVKSYSGGYNSFTFSDNYELLALAGQDDCVSLIDMNTKSYMRMI
jgi:WD40 repeat protein